MSSLNLLPHLTNWKPAAKPIPAAAKAIEVITSLLVSESSSFLLFTTTFTVAASVP